MPLKNEGGGDVNQVMALAWRLRTELSVCRYGLGEQSWLLPQGRTRSTEDEKKHPTPTVFTDRQSV